MTMINEATSAIRVLLVEDSPTWVETVTGLLSGIEGRPFELEACNDLESGVDLLVEKEFQVVLLDLNLPDSRGLETCVRLCGRFPGIPMVVLTVENEGDIARQALLRGAQDYLLKGRIDQDLLARALRHAIERHRLLADLETRRSESESHAENLRSLLARDAYGILVVDSEGLVRYVNAAAEELFGHSAARLLGKPFGFPLISGKPREISLFRETRDEVMVEMWVGDLEWDGRPSKLVRMHDMGRRVPTVVDLNAFLREEQEALANFLGEWFELEVYLTEEELRFRCHRDRLRQVLYSLATNARDAMKDGGRLSLTAACVELGIPRAPRPLAIPYGPYVQLSLTDEGHAFDEVSVSGVLNPWPDGLAMPKRVSPGLITACELIQDAGGCLWLESHPNATTIFELYFPRLA